MREYLLTLLVAASVTYLTAGLVRRFALRHHVLAEIRDRDVHSTPTPRLGGVALFLGLCAALAVASRLPLLSQVFEGEPRALLLGALLICALGVADDVWGLDALTKLAGQVVAAGVMALEGIQLLWLPVPGQTIALDPVTGPLLTIVVVVVTVNAVNMVDGLDGLAAGVVGIAALAFFTFSYVLSVQNSYDRATTSSLATAVLAGMCVGFLPHNVHPARIFMGDSGSMLIGLLLAASTITLTGRLDPGVASGLGLVPALVPLLLPLAVLAVPFLDLALAVVRRTRSRRSPFAPDKQHLHHRLLEIGHSHRRAVAVMWVWSALIAFGTVGLAFAHGPFALLVMALAVVGAVVLVSLPTVGRGSRTPAKTP